ncbi:PucR family transcriptional regulator [Enemella evansiae]|uniref:PucR family transcriptional regulator n=1 Tax=Enemella evansiae TaxID=2016499 RepID=UPI000B95DE85|nr:helix-turn-helix domain-containing protein [Enemella evansiae]OYN96995.1 hypothetical protein CGZ96_12000 [Enemella evansiae]OYO06163.1 hypothetical protein CGZ97_05840 [Enemella evansiae]PFG68892.1 PucR-like helix-turn-helix protein [Propionibacteriaceae bacterium ES.041]
MANALQQLADDLAARLARSVTVVTPEIEIICASAHFGDEDPARTAAVLRRVALPEVYRHIHGHDILRWQGPDHLRAAPDLGFKRRYAVPLRERGTVLGILMVIDDPSDPLDAAQRAQIAQASTTATELLALEADAEQPRHDARARLLSDLLGTDPQRYARALRQVRSELINDQETVLVLAFRLLGAPSTRAGAALRAGFKDLGHREPTRLLPLVSGEHATLLAVFAEPPDQAAVRGLADRAARAVSDRLDGGECVVGMPQGGVPLDAVRDARRQALSAADAAALLPTLPRVSSFGELGSYPLLLAWPRDQLDDFIPPPLRTLLAADGPLAETLRTYLDTAGSIPETTRRLALHRTSLYYRLSRLREALGCDPADPGVREGLQLGVRADEIQRATGHSDKP